MTSPKEVSVSDRIEQIKGQIEDGVVSMHHTKWLLAERERLGKALDDQNEEYEIAARFGEWLGVDMSGCYDAADMVSLWKTHIEELKEGINV